MRRRLDRALRRWWRGDAGAAGAIASVLARPLEIGYGSVVALRNRAYDAGWLPRHRSAVPVISVGNLLVGGTGKTPVAAWIGRILADHDREPALVIRGYGDDEIGLHRRWNPDVPVFAGADRARAVADAVEAGRRSVVLDDGFQHRRLHRDLDLVLVPVEEPWCERLLPRGPYREPRRGLARADRIVLTRRTADRDRARRLEARLRERLEGMPVAHLHLAPRRWLHLDGTPAAPPDGPVLAVTGIARPRSFALLVERATGSAPELMSFPDHHEFTSADLDEIRRRSAGRTVVTTEKDAVRLEDGAALPSDPRVLALEVEEESGAGKLRDAVFRVTGGNPAPSVGTPPSGRRAP